MPRFLKSEHRAPLALSVAFTLDLRLPADVGKSLPGEQLAICLLSQAFLLVTGDDDGDNDDGSVPIFEPRQPTGMEKLSHGSRVHVKYMSIH